MLEDRDYMRPDFERGSWRRSAGWPRLSLTVWLIVINVAVFLVQLVLPERLWSWAVLSPRDLLHGFVWQLLTYQFLHGGFLHLLMNGVGLYFFGRPLEQTLGARRMLSLYLASGVVGGLVQCGLSFVFPGHFGMGGVVGASAGVFGLIACFAMLNRETPITLLLVFLPVTMRAKYLLVFEALLGLAGLIAANDNIAHGAHLGGMALGLLYALYLERGRALFGGRRQTTSRIATLEFGPKAGRPARAAKLEPELTADEFLEREVDPILEKISAHGIQSLTERERRILETARQKIQRR